MDKTAAKKMVKDTLEQPFDFGRFADLVNNILNHFEHDRSPKKDCYPLDAFIPYISKHQRLGSYEDSAGKVIDILVVILKKETSLERARSIQRNFVARCLENRRGRERSGALVAFVAPNQADWRFSLVKMEYQLDARGKVEKNTSPARRYSFLVGGHESSHTAQSRLMPFLLNDTDDPTLDALESAFSVEPVTNEFFEQYRELFNELKKALDKIVAQNDKVNADFAEKKIDTGDFAKKLLGQIVFLCFLQKKGWLGVERGNEWGSGSKKFLRELFARERGNKRFFNEILEPLFYKALRSDDRPDDDYFKQFKCKIPFLNGGLFDPMNDYDWKSGCVPLDDGIFSNNKRTKRGDVGNGILDVFDRYNFTVKEDEPLEKDVAVDPEMLGNVFEKLLKNPGALGTFYTPREIVHYMCQESLINYLVTELGGKASAADIEVLIQRGDAVVENDSRVVNAGRETKDYPFMLPEKIRDHAKTIDEKLSAIRVCDPAVGSGAFPVGMMNEIIRARNALSNYITGESKRSLYQFKRHAIANCLYGVDIDASAVDIAKLRLWLSLIVDEEDREKIQPLPNLDYKIICGNSLLKAQKLLKLDSFDELEDLRSRYFDETNAAKKKKYKQRVAAIVDEITGGHAGFDFKVHFSGLFPANAARGNWGFHIVIANPPYVKKENLDPKTIKQLEQNFHEVKNKKANPWSDDLYAHFVFRGVEITRDAGVVCYITNDSFIGLSNKARVRHLLMQHDLRKLIRCPRETFEAMIYTAVFVLRKHESQERAYESGRFTYPQFEYEMLGSVSLDTAVTMPNSRLVFASPILKVYEKLSGLQKVKNHIRILDAGIHTGNVRTKIFFRTKEREGLHRLLQGKQIVRWGVFWDIARAQYKYCDTGYVPKKRKGIGRKGRPSKHNEYWSFHGIENHHQPERLLMRQSDDDLLVAYHSEKEHGRYYTDNTLFTILPKSGDVSLKYAMALLNSKLLNSLYQFLSQEEGKTLAQIKVGLVNELPFCAGSQKPIIALVDKILTITRAADYLTNPEKQSKVRALEAEIDKLVYQLYGLTPEEITVIETHSKK